MPSSRLNIFFFGLLFFCGSLFPLGAQNSLQVFDGFEGNGTITTWFGDDCEINTSRSNPFPQDGNTSATVMEYHDIGGQYANVRFQVAQSFDLSERRSFSLKIYVPTDGLTGDQPNQVSFKLQDGRLNEPWTTQSEIIKSIMPDQWQTVTFDFGADNYRNLDPTSLPPSQRTDFNRVVIQVNGENNNDQVLAYIDDVTYEETVSVDPVYDQLVWSDEFEANGAIDSDKWFHQTRLPDGGSWYNGEIQHYTDRQENSYLADGSLHIVARKENFTDQGETKSHTSARLNSKFAFQYGRVEVRAKLPFGVGTWPAIWMLGQNINENGAYWQTEGYGTTGWPACGEIDIMEHWGNNQDYVQSAMHTPSSFGATVNHGGRMLPGASTDFHVYALEWSPEKMVFSVDGIVHYTYNPEEKNAATWPFDAPQYLILNVAIQPSIAPSFTSSAMEIDYVRVYQESTTATSTPVDSQVKVYPNPVEDTLTIELVSENPKPVQVRLFDLNGQLLQTRQNQLFQQLQIDNLGGLPAGVYFLEFTSEGKVQRLQFVKQ